MRVGKSLTATLLLLTWAATMSAVSVNSVSSVVSLSTMLKILVPSKIPYSRHDRRAGALLRVFAPSRNKRERLEVERKGERVELAPVDPVVIVAASANRREARAAIQLNRRISVAHFEMDTQRAVRAGMIE